MPPRGSLLARKLGGSGTPAYLVRASQLLMSARMDTLMLTIMLISVRAAEALSRRFVSRLSSLK